MNRGLGTQGGPDELAVERDIDVRAFLQEAAAEDSGIFRYQPGDSFLHRIHPVTKLIVSIGLIIVVFMMPDYRIPFVMLAVLLGLAWVARIHRNVLTVVVAIGTPLTVSILLIHGMFYPGNTTRLFTIGSVPIIGSIAFWREGVAFALLVITRVLVLMAALLVTILTTHPRELTVALAEKGISRKVSYVFLAALQFIPDMRERADAVLEAQQARGLDTHANLFRRIKAFVALMTPILIGTLIASETRALALESRGFARTGEGTSLFEVTETKWDKALQAGTVIVTVAVVGWAILS